MRSRATPASEALTRRARAALPGGVSSPVRAFFKVGGAPIYLCRGQGACVEDEDGNAYLDFCLGWGALILGHARPEVVEAVRRAAGLGLCFGAAHRDEVELAGLALSAYPWAERLRFTVSGTEAVMTALRLARAATGRTKILKFRGCYHGHADGVLVGAGSGLVTQGLAESAGVPDGVTGDTLVAPLGDLEAVDLAFKLYGEQIAAVILEPVPANNGLLIQDRAWHHALAQRARQAGALLLYDEVITGFRFGFQGYGARLGIEPDLVTLGKILGGGLPVAAVLGRARLLDQLAPLGAVYQAGTMAANPVALAAGLATLRVLEGGEVYRHLEALGRALDAGAEACAARGGPRIHREGPMFWPLFSEVRPREAAQIPAPAAARYHAAYGGWLERGLYLPPSAYEVGFLSAAHRLDDVDRLLEGLPPG